MTYFLIGAVFGLLIMTVVKLADKLSKTRNDLTRYARMNSELAIEKRVLVDKVVALKRS